MTDGADYFPTIRLLADYEVWCNAKAIEAAAALPEADLFRRFPFGFGTIHETLHHTVAVFRKWAACVGPVVAPPEWLEYDPAVPLAEIARINERVSREFLRALDTSHDAGVLHEGRRLVQVFHLVGHGTHHRTQFISMLRMLGQDPPFEAGDFGGWTRERGF